MKQEQAHNEKRQFRRQCERTGLVGKSGRQWKKFKKALNRTLRQTSNEVAEETMISAGEFEQDLRQIAQNNGPTAEAFAEKLLATPPAITSPLDDPTIL